MSSVTVIHGDDVPLSTIVAANIRAEAGRRGWKQKDLAAALGVTPTTISRKWLGLRLWQLDELEGVAHALGVSVTDLMVRGRWAHWGSNPEPTDKTLAVVIPLFDRHAS